MDASKPRVELSQARTVARVMRASAMETRLRSPPETPRMLGEFVSGGVRDETEKKRGGRTMNRQR